ncbi:TIGR04376 family protein [Leptolyngbya sp. 'hensonii']|uniref:TIGR04376 family protein n=1 Tax=Leptolyngbya sp. 'hensonii' TaxID=1922337 RepID=UPI000950309F|nr:TIGR04376 family protein [Leptolyngbya sp. 'hensonii']OLP16280.1 TIGR04376 family protein [Leptolyngbya sp. 'hensonii']
MGLFEDFSQFLETRLEEFVRNNPQLELQALEEQLREQEETTLQLRADLQLQDKRLQEEILATAQEIQRWHIRIDKAKAAGRTDLVQPAQEREAALLRQGNQLWGQMQGLKERKKQAEELQRKIQLRRQEIQTKIAQLQAEQSKARTEQSWQSTAWNQNTTYNSFGQPDPLEAQFKRWETEEELNQLKRNMGQ